MPPFHVILHALPAGSLAAMATGAAQSFEGRSWPVLQPTHEQLNTPFPVAFEEAAERLEQFERMFFEPDGSFVWVGDSPGQPTPWQLDGVLYDHGGRIAHIELKGTAPPAALHRLLEALGGAASDFVFQSVRQAIFVDARAWLRASSDSEAPENAR